MYNIALYFYILFATGSITADAPMNFGNTPKGYASLRYSNQHVLCLPTACNVLSVCCASTAIDALVLSNNSHSAIAF